MEKGILQKDMIVRVGDWYWVIPKSSVVEFNFIKGPMEIQKVADPDNIKIVKHYYFNFPDKKFYPTETALLESATRAYEAQDIVYKGIASTVLFYEPATEWDVIQSMREVLEKNGD